MLLKFCSTATTIPTVMETNKIKSLQSNHTVIDNYFLEGTRLFLTSSKNLNDDMKNGKITPTPLLCYTQIQNIPNILIYDWKP